VVTALPVCCCACPQELEAGKLLWLFANTICERTFIARKRRDREHTAAAAVVAA
jgi:hypothetical protein